MDKDAVLPENASEGDLYPNKVLRLRINGRFLGATIQTGVQRWANEVLLELQRNPNIDLEILKPKPFFSSGLPGHIWEQFILPIVGDRGRTLVSLANWGPYFTSNQVLVIHDLIPLKNPSLFSKSYSLACKFLLPRIISQSKWLCVPSIETSNELTRLLGLPTEKIKVLGAGIRFSDPVISEDFVNPFGFKYFLFLGGFNSRKNLNFLLNFWSQLNDQEIKLVVVTRRDERVTSQEVIVDVNPSVVIVEDPEDDFLFSLYRNSIALLFPSLSEGFGLPLLEVISTGKPFISSQVGVAKDLCVGNSRILELTEELWLAEVNRLASEISVSDENQKLLARQYDWGQVADKLIDAIVGGPEKQF